MSSKSIDFVLRMLPCRSLQRFLQNYARARTNARDLKRLNREADELNAKAAEVLGFQNFDPQSE
jgi:hypothetical protein